MKKKLKILILMMIGVVILGAPVVIKSQVDKIVGGAVSIPARVTLTVTFSGGGTGVVTGDVGGFTATAPVTTVGTFTRGTVITLTATPSGISSFLGWTGAGCAGVGVCVITLSESKTVDAGFWGVPNPACLWAWFRHNEGSGATIIDYSPTATNGVLVNSVGAPSNIAEQNYFWNTNPGFGTGNLGGGVSCKTQRTAPAANSGNVSILGFIRPLGDGFFNPGQFIQLGEDGTKNFVRIGWVHAGAHFWTMEYSAGTKTSALAATYGTWYCVYAYSQASANNNGMYFRKSGDAGWTNALLNQGGAAIATNQTGVYKFGGVTNPISGVGGDVFYYACAAPEGIISLVQATDIFNQFKARYGML